MAIGLGITMWSTMSRQYVRADVSGESIRCGTINRPGLDAFTSACVDAIGAKKSLRSLSGIPISLGIGALVAMTMRPKRKPSEFAGDLVNLRSVRQSDLPGLRLTIDATVIEEQGWNEPELMQRDARVDEGERGLQFVILVPPLDGSPERTVIAGQIGAEPGPDGAWMMGYWLGEAWRGHGYASDAAVVLVKTLLDAGVPSIHAECADSNEASQRVLENAGLEMVGSYRRRLPNGRVVNALRYVRYSSVPSGYSNFRA